VSEPCRSGDRPDRTGPNGGRDRRAAACDRRPSAARLCRCPLVRRRGGVAPRDRSVLRADARGGARERRGGRPPLGRDRRVSLPRRRARSARRGAGARRATAAGRREEAWLRSLLGTGGAMALFYALGTHAISVGDATTLYSTAAALVPCSPAPCSASAWVLWCGSPVVGGFVGVATLLHAGFASVGRTGLIVLAGALSYALAIFRLRRLSSRESSEAIGFHMSVTAERSCCSLRCRVCVRSRARRGDRSPPARSPAAWARPSWAEHTPREPAVAAAAFNYGRRRLHLPAAVLLSRRVSRRAPRWRRPDVSRRACSSRSPPRGAVSRGAGLRPACSANHGHAQDARHAVSRAWTR